MCLTDEFAIHCIIWGGGVAYAIYSILLKSPVILKNGKAFGDFQDGWPFIGREKDSADNEWEIVVHFIYQFISWLTLYLIVSEYLRNKYNKILSYWQITLSVFALFYFIHWKGLLLVLIQPMLYETFKICNGKRTYLCTALALLLTYFFKSLAYTTSVRHHIDDTQHFLIVLIISWMTLKCHSYYSTDNKKHRFIKALAYFLYMPTLILGPFISYEYFINCERRSEDLSSRITTLILNLLRFTFWLLFMEFALHYLYVNALSFQPQVVASLNWWELCGYGYSMGQLFHLQYFVVYGISTTVCKFEQIPVPITPRCIGRVAFYSDMWRYFDKGLYNFLLRHIYIPVLKTTNSKAVASSCSFLFVYVWHGIQVHIFIWSLFNLIGVFIEQTFREMYSSDIMTKNFSQQWRKRLFCICSSPSLAISAISNFYFFTNVEIGNIFVHKFLQGTAKEILTLMFFLYSCCQVSLRFSKFKEVTKSNV